VLRYATMNGAKGLRLDGKVGSLTPGKEADVIILDAEAINVAPLNQVPGAVVSLMDRTNVETVIVAGKIRKWKGKLVDVDLNRLRQQLESSRDYIFSAAGIPRAGCRKRSRDALKFDLSCARAGHVVVSDVSLSPTRWQSADEPASCASAPWSSAPRPRSPGISRR
jgi:hypothetical protein